MSRATKQFQKILEACVRQSSPKVSQMDRQKSGFWRRFKGVLLWTFAFGEKRGWVGSRNLLGFWHDMRQNRFLYSWKFREWSSSRLSETEGKFCPRPHEISTIYFNRIQCDSQSSPRFFWRRIHQRACLILDDCHYIAKWFCPGNLAVWTYVRHD
jgi:hypothetical protein